MDLVRILRHDREEHIVDIHLRHFERCANYVQQLIEASENENKIIVEASP